MRSLALGAVLALACVAGSPAAGSDATRAQVAALAARALSDPAALRALRAVGRVDGERVDLAAALEASGPALSARLRLLAASARRSPPVQPLPDSRAAASTILRERRFSGSAVPRPLHRPLSWLGGQLHRVARGLGHGYRSLSAWLPGGARAFWLLLSAAVAAFAGYVALGLGRRRAGRLIEARGRPSHSTGDDPRRLERQADEAERGGDYEGALRLRFRAGLLRLALAAVIPPRTSLTNGEIARRLGSGSFRGVAADFDEVVYGGRAASSEDAARARAGWERVLEETRPR